MGSSASDRGKIRGILAGIWLVVATVLFAAVVGKHYALKDWLFFRYATYVVGSFFLVGCSGVLGFAVVGRVGGPGLPLSERCALAPPVGLLAFALSWALLGFVGAMSVAMFFALPLLCLLLGVALSRSEFRRIYRHRSLLFRLAPLGLGQWLLFAYGVLGILLVYVPILTIENISYDTRWYHMAIAETYAATGRIEPFREGWMLGAMPQLVTYLFAWAFELPGSILFDRIEFCAHLEFVLFLATLAGIPVLVRRVLPRRRVQSGMSWVFVFFFPGIFLYDSNLIAGADHIAALWAVPVFLTFLRAQRALALRPMVLFALVVVGLMHTKYTAFQVLVFPGLGLVYRLGQRLVSDARGRRLTLRLFAGPLAATAVVVVLFAPHWLKNLAFYGDPMFPMAHGVFHSRPWVANVPARMSILFAGEDWKPAHGAPGFLRSLRALVDFSFIPNDWETFHGKVPVFGSLFTLTVPCLLFLKKTRRLWALYAACHFAVFFWFRTAHQDRYLQVSLPLMAAAVAAVFLAVWELGLFARAGSVLLIALQVVWGGDVPFFPTHAMMDMSPFTATIEHLSSGFRGKRDERFRAIDHVQRMRDAMPADAVVLIHEEPMHLGIGVRVVSDIFQTGIDYALHASPDRVYDLLRGLGVTHVMNHAGDSKVTDSLGGDIAFNYFFKRYAVRPKPYGGFLLARMPAERPNAAEFHDRVLVLGCDETYASGLYSFSDLDVPAWHGADVTVPPFPEPLTPVSRDADIEPLLDQVDAVVQKASCFPTSVQLGTHGFLDAFGREEYRVWIRKTGSL